ncbi:MAG TPA: hypothetical protein P5136_00560 [Methanofastidiosum sp.]|nr:hypothetical protein [Methanofastidiosum sp.]
MHSEIFSKGLKISKNYKKRNSQETQELYKIINKAVVIAKEKEHKESSRAMQFLIDLYTPFISSISFNLYKKLCGTVEFNDIKQEVCYNFIFLVNRYDNSKSEFSYYIQKMLPRYMIKWVNKELVYYSRQTPLSNNINTYFDETLNSTEAVESYLHSYIVNNEYIDFILKKSEEKSKSKTNKEICLNFFLGSDTIAVIADRLGISYHAVYQKRKSMEEEIKQFFQTNVLCGYRLTTTGLVPE